MKRTCYMQAFSAELGNAEIPLLTKYMIASWVLHWKLKKKIWLLFSSKFQMKSGEDCCPPATLVCKGSWPMVSVDCTRCLSLSRFPLLFLMRKIAFRMQHFRMGVTELQQGHHFQAFWSSCSVGERARRPCGGRKVRYKQSQGEGKMTSFSQVSGLLLCLASFFLIEKSLAA